MNILAQGAEAIIFKNEDGDIVKERIPKKYRLAIIDEKLRKTRTRREAKIIQKITALGIPAPKLKNADDINMRITMENIQGTVLKDCLHTNTENFGQEIGKKIGLMHANNIIHGDLTTSNMILNKEITFIDFGLSFLSQKEEDKAVDLHALKQALQSKHHTIAEQCFNTIIQGYKETNPNSDSIFKRLEKVEQRGRNKK